jgi:hypothetical protein
MVAKDQTYQNTMKNADKQEARTESDRVLQSVVMSVMLWPFPVVALVRALPMVNVYELVKGQVMPYRSPFAKNKNFGLWAAGAAHVGFFAVESQWRAAYISSMTPAAFNMRTTAVEVVASNERIWMQNLNVHTRRKGFRT